MRIIALSWHQEIKPYKSMIIIHLIFRGTIKLYTGILIVFLCLPQLSIKAQQSTISAKALAAQGGKIKLRWIITGDTSIYNSNNGNYLNNVWKRYLDYGFIIERRRSGSSTTERYFTAKPDIEKLTEGALNLTTSDERKACVAMKTAIFGTKNELYPDPSIISPKVEISNRHFGTMVASTISYKGACYAGLGIIDDTALPNIVYDYIIREANPPDAIGNYSIKVTVENVFLITQTTANIQKAKQSRVAAGQQIAAVLQAPPTPIAKFGNKKVELKWRWKKPSAVNAYQDLYYGYYIERASPSDTTRFVRLNNLPFISTTSKSDTLIFIDQDTTQANTVLQNGKKYIYKLIGKTYFDDEIAALQTVSGKCEDDSRYIPTIVSNKLLANNQVELKWNLPTKASPNHFKSFSIGRTEKITQNTAYQKIPTIAGILSLDSTKRTAIVNNNTGASNTTKSAYYVIIGKTKTEEEFISFPVFIQGVDTLAPNIPVNVKAIWDETKKTATVTWNANTETDLLGYKIFRSIPGSPPVIISDTSISKKTIFVDTIKVENLKVLYYIMAIDKQFNPSKLSLPGILQILDKTPPIKPSFSNYKVNNQGKVEFIIYKSPSDDVASHELRRKVDTVNTSLTKWLTPSKPTSNTYTDINLTNGGVITYIVEAVDSTGNKNSDTLNISVPSVLVAKPQFTIFNSSSSRIDPSINLKWDYSIISASNAVLEFVILKSDVSVDPTGKLGTWKTVSGDTREISDYNVYYERSYKYAIKAVFKDGSTSTWLYTNLAMPTVCGAARYLEEKGQIEPGNTVLKEACDSIILLPGFEAKRNSNFEAKIKPK